MGKKSSEVRLRQAATQALESLQRAGVTSLPRPRKGSGKTPAGKSPASHVPPPAIASEKAVPKSSSTKPVAPTVSSVARPQASAMPCLSKLDQLGALRSEVAACVRCAELASTRTQTVFGVGNPDARLCFFGEAPGADEDRLGEPFVGRAGQLLDKIIQACHLRREDVYICNVLRCRPPGNRNPSPDEVANCRQHFERQLAIVKPEFVVCLGTVAAQALLETTETIGKLRKKIFERAGMRIACTYHPAYLLRNPAAKRDVWDDMKMLMAEMGVTL